ncbi:cytochrome P450, partial [Streptomyces sp. DT225]
HHEFYAARSRKQHPGPAPADVDTARDDLDAYFRELIGRKRREPGDGLLDELIARQLETGAVERDALVRLAEILLVAGHETTANMISLGTFTLLRHPDQLARLTEGGAGAVPAA